MMGEDCDCGDGIDNSEHVLFDCHLEWWADFKRFAAGVERLRVACS